MKKIIWILILFLGIQAEFVFAEDLEESSKAVKLNQPALGDAQFAALKSRVEALEREVAKLNQVNRFQDEKIRNLERSVDDIQRRHLR